MLSVENSSVVRAGASGLRERWKRLSLEYNSKGYHYATVHAPITCPRDLCLRFWLYDIPERHKAGTGKEKKPVP